MFSRQEITHFRAFGFVVLRGISGDPRLFQGSTDLLGAMTVPTPGVAVCFAGSPTPWHNDQGPDAGGVKFLVHLELLGVLNDGDLR